MTGQILAYSIQTNSAVISGDDGNRYAFSGDEWQEAGMPTRGMRVDFAADGSLARGVYSEERLSRASSAGLNAATAIQAGEIADTTAAIQSRAWADGIRQYVGRIGAAVMGVTVLLGLVLPALTYAFFSLTGIGYYPGIERYPYSILGWDSIREADHWTDYARAGLHVLGQAVIAILAVLGIASVVLPRAVPATVGAIGVVIMALHFVPFFVIYAQGGYTFGMIAPWGFGLWEPMLAFLLMAVLQLVPRTRN